MMQAIKQKNPALARWIKPTVDVILVGIIAWLLARSVWFVLFGFEVEPLDMTQNTTPALTDQTILDADVSALQSGTLFGSERVEPSLVSSESLPETQLDLTLRGVRFAPEPDQSSALIDSPNEGQQNLILGDEIASGITLEEIFVDRVVINRRGTRENLFLREDTARQRAATLSENGSSNARSMARFSQADWINGLRLEPYSENGAMIGYQITENASQDFLQAIGLQTGDIITELNGFALNRSTNTLELMEDLSEADRARFVVLRNQVQDIIEMEIRE